MSSAVGLEVLVIEWDQTRNKIRQIDVLPTEVDQMLDRSHALNHQPVAINDPFFIDLVPNPEDMLELRIHRSQRFD